MITSQKILPLSMGEGDIIEEPVVIFCTVPSREEAVVIARTLVTERLAACVQITGEVNSFFTWEEKLCEEQEILLIIKSVKSVFPGLCERLKELHAYEVPEIIALPIVAGNKDYLDWLKENVSI